MPRELDDIMSPGAGSEPASDDQAQGQPQDQGRARDEHGRFAAQEGQEGSQEPAQADQQQGAPQDQQEQKPAPRPGYVPQQALDEARHGERSAKAENEALRQHLAAMQQQISQLTGYVQGAVKPPEQAPKPDWWVDPDAALEARLNEVVQPLTQQTGQWREQVSQMMAVEKHGQEVVQAADAALAQYLAANPQAKAWLGPRIMNSPHPYGEMVRWHQEQSALTTTGSDPNKWFETEFEKRYGVKPDQFQAQAAGQPPPQANGAMPSSFTGARNAGPRSQPQWQGPKALSDIMPR